MTHRFRHVPDGCRRKEAGKGRTPQRLRAPDNGHLVPDLIPVAHATLEARAVLQQGVERLLGHIPAHACWYCSPSHLIPYVESYNPHGTHQMPMLNVSLHVFAHRSCLHVLHMDMWAYMSTSVGINAYVHTYIATDTHVHTHTNINKYLCSH